MDKAKLGKEIYKWRKHRSLTQNQLAAGICNQSEISRLEKGEVFPSIDVLHLIAQKLKVPTYYFFEVLTHYDIAHQNSVNEQISYLSDNKNYKDIYLLVEKELKRKEFHPEFKQFLLYQYYLSAYYLKKISSATCLTELKLLLKQEIYGTHIIQNLYIKNSIANIYAVEKNYIQSISYYKSILEEDIFSKEYEAFCIKVQYNFSKVLFLNGDYEQSLKSINKTIDTAIRSKNISLLGQLYFQKAECLEELDYPFDSIAECYQKSLFIFQLINLKYYEVIILQEKKQYLN